MANTITRPCRYCGNEKAESYAATPSTARCISCGLKYKREWYQQNREYVLVRRKRHYRMNRTAILAAQRAKRMGGDYRANQRQAKKEAAHV